MARTKDENKRATILQSAKMLFSKNGFFNTSISDIVKETNLPVGSVYTYFKNKEDIVMVIVEEGWEDLYVRLEQTILSQGSDEMKLKALIESFIPEILNDVDLINILLSEAISYTKLEEKLDKLSNMVYKLLKDFAIKEKTSFDLPPSSMRTAIAVYFLGILNTIKIAKSSPIGISENDIKDFLKATVEKSMNIKLK